MYETGRRKEIFGATPCRSKLPPQREGFLLCTLCSTLFVIRCLKKAQMLLEQIVFCASTLTSLTHRPIPHIQMPPPHQPSKGQPNSTPPDVPPQLMCSHPPLTYHPLRYTAAALAAAKYLVLRFKAIPPKMWLTNGWWPPLTVFFLRSMHQRAIKISCVCNSSVSKEVLYR